jgi:hypothetical protein
MDEAVEERYSVGGIVMSTHERRGGMGKGADCSVPGVIGFDLGDDPF